MTNRAKQILSLGAAIASLSGVTAQGANVTTVETAADTSAAALTGSQDSLVKASGHFQVGEDLLGFVMTKQADGTLVAGHASHSSHASHASHVSSR